MSLANQSYRKQHLKFTADDSVGLMKKCNLSYRATYNILRHMKLQFRQQKVIFEIVGRNSIRNEVLSRTGDLFDQFDGVLNIGSDASPKYDNISIVYCTNITTLVQRVLSHRSEPDLPISAKMGCDHGQGKLLVTLSLNFSNSVKEILIIGASLEGKENKSCLRWFLGISIFPDHWSLKFFCYLKLFFPYKLISLIKVDEYIKTLGTNGKFFLKLGVVLGYFVCCIVFTISIFSENFGVL